MKIVFDAEAGSIRVKMFETEQEETQFCPYHPMFLLGILTTPFVTNKANDDDVLDFDVIVTEDDPEAFVYVDENQQDGGFGLVRDLEALYAKLKEKFEGRAHTVEQTESYKDEYVRRHMNQKGLRSADAMFKKVSSAVAAVSVKQGAR